MSRTQTRGWPEVTFNERGPDDGGDVRATETEAPAKRQLGSMMPRPDVWVALVGGPLDGKLMRRRSWNGRINLARGVLDYYGTHRADLDYAADPAATSTSLDGVIIFTLRYTGGAR